MYDKRKVRSLLKKVEALKKDVLKTEKKYKTLLKRVHPDHLTSARNLLHYLAIRSHDLRKLQKGLSELAISSHSHSESYSLNNLLKIEYLLNALLGNAAKAPVCDMPDLSHSMHILNSNAAQLLGKPAFHGQSKIMVTLPAEAGSDETLVCNFVKQGMNIARINTAHDNKKVWQAMVQNVRHAADKLGKKVRIYMDIEGPKLRTGAIKKEYGENGDDKKPFIQLFEGALLKITRENKEGHDGLQPAISLTLPEVFDHVSTNDRVWFDDGQLGGVVCNKNRDYMTVAITQAPEDGFKLKAEKGVNFPDSNIKLPALTDEDIERLGFIAANADMVGFSFVQTAEDIYALQKQLHKLKRDDMGIILKIETQLAFQNLPSLLFATLRSKHCGVMVARGDLAVEIGYERMAEVQEEILWLTEAAHLPVIWATQVLESQVKKGRATRAEISDVVKAVRAECVMLNKGPHILEAITTIKDIDKRMAGHEDKKRKILRSLNVAKAFLE